jgi:hypothetical protein
MSGTIPTPVITPPAMPPDPPTPTVDPWAKPSISVIGLLIFAVGYTIAYLTRDTTVMTMFAGAAIAMGQQVIGYWLGSSSGSTNKDATIAAAATAPKGPIP